MMIVSLAIAGFVLFALAFLRQPLVEGSAAESLTRGGFILSVLVYPEALVQSWTDGGRLPGAFADRLPIALGTAAWLTLALLAGWPWVKLLQFNTHQPSLASPLASASLTSPSLALRMHRIAWAMLLGLAWLSTATLLVGQAGLLAMTEPVHMPLRTPLVIACAAVVALSAGSAKAVSGLIGKRTLTLNAQPESPSTTAAAQWLDDFDDQPINVFDRGLGMLTRLLVVWLCVVTMLGAWVPSAEFDVLEYHLQAPREFYELGAIRFLPHNIYANMPLGIEMHTLAAMTLTGFSDTWWSGLIGKSITASFSLTGALLLGSYFASRRESASSALSGWCAAGLWLASPGIAHVAQLGLIDGALATYVLAACMAATRAYQATLAAPLSATLPTTHTPSSLDSRIEPALDVTSETSRDATRSKFTWWFVASVMAGAAAAAKYPGLIFAVLPLLVVYCTSVWQLRGVERSATALTRHWLRDSVVTLLIIGAGLASTCVPWYAKNAVLAGNPVYPLAASMLGGRTLTSEKIAQWQAAHRVPGSWSDVLPRALADGWRLLVASPFVQPAMVIGFLIAVVLLVRQRTSNYTASHSASQSTGHSSIHWSRAWWLWLAWSVWILLVWWCATHRIDRFWLPWTGLASGLATLGIAWLGQQSRWLAHALVVCGVGYGALVNSSSVVSDNRYFVSLAALRSDMGDQEQVGRISPHLAWINTHLRDANAKVLMIGEAAVFEYQVPIVYSTCFDANPGEPLLRDRTLEDQRRELEQNGITHLLVNWREIERYRSPGNYGFSDWPTRADIAALESSGLFKRIPMPTEAAELFELAR